MGSHASFGAALRATLSAGRLKTKALSRVAFAAVVGGILGTAATLLVTETLLSTDKWLALTAVGTLLLALATAWLALEARSQRSQMSAEFTQSRTDDWKRREEERALRELGMEGALAREVAANLAAVIAMVAAAPTSAALPLSVRVWRQVEVELGEIRNPLAMASIELVYQRIELVADALQEGFRSRALVSAAVLTQLLTLRPELETLLRSLDQRGTQLRARFGWPRTPEKEEARLRAATAISN